MQNEFSFDLIKSDIERVKSVLAVVKMEVIPLFDEHSGINSAFIVLKIQLDDFLKSHRDEIVRILTTHIPGLKEQAVAIYDQLGRKISNINDDNVVPNPEKAYSHIAPSNSNPDPQRHDQQF